MENQKQKKELNEAITAGNQALYSLQAAEKQLSGAKGLGLWDMLGGGIFVTWMKHSKIDSASDCMQQANRNLNRFRKELADIEVPMDVEVEVGQFLTFADFFFDGLVADVMVQSRIKDASEQVEDAICHVEQILNTLKNVEKGL